MCKRMKARGGALVPEDRLPPIVARTVVMVADLFMYGWMAERRVQWTAPIVGTAIQGFDLAVILVSTETYLIDAFPVHARLPLLQDRY